jgi:hypothetical protein
VAGGFASRDDIVRGAAWLTRNLLGKHKYADEMLRPHAERLTDQRLREHERRQRSWPPVTDCDRLAPPSPAMRRAGAAGIVSIVRTLLGRGAGR